MQLRHTWNIPKTLHYSFATFQAIVFPSGNANVVFQVRAILANSLILGQLPLSYLCLTLIPFDNIQQRNISIL